MKLKKQFNRISISLLIATTLFGCVSEVDNRKKDDATQEETTKESKEQIEARSEAKVDQIKKIFYSLPSPIELTYLFKKEGINYQADKLHSIAARNNYNVTIKKALNLGVYGADLSYAGLFGNHEDAIEYYTTCQILAEEIGIGQTFQKEFISRIESNADNRDTLLQVISDFFLDNDAYLKDHRQQHISTYILIGGWIEGMYLGTQMEVKESDSKGIRTIIAGQKHSLISLLVLLNNIEDEESLNVLRENMEDLAKLFDQINYVKADENKQKVEKKNGKIVLNTGESDTKIDDKTFEQIKNLVKEIRTSIIS